MIKRTHHCCCCFRLATRQCLDRPREDGSQAILWLCSACPNPAQVDERSAVVRERWSDDTFYAKFWHISVKFVADRRSTYDYRDHIGTISNLTGQVIRTEGD